MKKIGISTGTAVIYYRNCKKLVEIFERIVGSSNEKRNWCTTFWSAVSFLKHTCIICSNFVQFLPSTVKSFWSRPETWFLCPLSKRYRSVSVRKLEVHFRFQFHRLLAVLYLSRKSRLEIGRWLCTHQHRYAGCRPGRAVLYFPLHLVYDVELESLEHHL